MGLQNILEDFDSVEVTDTILDEKDRVALQAIEDRSDISHRDAAMVLKRYELLDMSVQQERSQAEYDGNSRGLFDVYIMAKEVHSFISNKHNQFVTEVVNYLATKYGFNEVVWRSKVNAVESWSYMDVASAILFESGTSGFSELGWREFKDKLQSTIFYSNGRGNQYSVKGKRVVFEVLSLKSYNWKMDFISEYSNKYYGLLLKALSFFENECDPSTYKAFYSEIDDLLFEFMPKVGDDVAPLYKSKTLSEGNSKTIESFRLYQNGRFDLTFLSEAKARDFVNLFKIG
jgi:hypothetical protein